MLFLIFFMIFCSFAEAFSIGSIIPFLTVLTTPSIIYSNKDYSFIINSLGIESPSQFLLFFTIIFSLLSLISGMLRLVLTWAQTNLSFSIASEISSSLFENTIYQEYEKHITQSSSEVIAALSKSNALVHNIIIPTLSIVSSFFLFITIMLTLIIYNPQITLYIMLSLSITYILILSFSKRKLQKVSLILSRNSIEINKIVQESLGGIKNIIINQSQPYFIRLFSNSNKNLQTAGSISQLLALSPRFGIESFGVIIIATFCYLYSQENNNLYVLAPTIGVIVFGIQKMLPLAQIIYSSIVSIRGNKSNLFDVLQFLKYHNQEKIEKSSNFLKIDIKGDLILSNVYFKYNGSDSYSLKDINLRIPFGSKVGFIGETASGKSTLVDLISSLILPETGQIKVGEINLNCQQNRLAWMSAISIVPQNIYLSNNTFIDNIAFGSENEKIDFERVKEAAIKAELLDTINQFPLKFHHNIEEGGLNLSGGQRQRIGIARALYKKSKILILDEATNALDNYTENQIMNTIYSLGNNLTIFIIAHRLSTLKNCDIIIELSKGKIDKVMNRDEFLLLKKYNDEKKF